MVVLLFVLLLNLGAFSLNLGTLPYELSPDARLYWKKIENKHLSAAYVFEKVLVKKGISRARQKYISLDSLNSDPYYHDLDEFNALGNRLLESGKLPEALDVFRLNVTAYPDDWRTHNTLAYAHMAARDYKAAIDSCRKILDLNPPYKEKILRIIEELQKELK